MHAMLTSPATFSETVAQDAMCDQLLIIDVSIGWNAELLEVVRRLENEIQASKEQTMMI